MGYLGRRESQDQEINEQKDQSGREFCCWALEIRSTLHVRIVGPVSVVILLVRIVRTDCGRFPGSERGHQPCALRFLRAPFPPR